MQNKEDLKQYAPAFKGIDVSINTLAWKEQLNSVTEVELFGPHRTPIHHMRIDGANVCILSEDDFTFSNEENIYNLDINAFLKPHSETEEPEHIKYTRERYARDKKINQDWSARWASYWYNKEEDEREIAEWELKQEQMKRVRDPAEFPKTEVYSKIVKIKFLNGDSAFNRHEQNILREWFQQPDVGTARMQELYIKQILKGFPLKAQAFRGSTLEALFFGK